MKREYYARRTKNCVKIYGTALSLFGEVRWEYMGKILYKSNEPLYYFVPSFFLQLINETLLNVIKKEIDLLKSREG